MSQYCLRCRRTLDLPGQIVFCPYCGQSLTATVAPAELDPNRTTAHNTHPTANTTQAPTTVGDYRLLRELGRGGMGVVYEGEHQATGRRVAVKLIDVEADESALERFRQEGKFASALSHPRCVFVFAADQDAGRPFIVLELMPGRTLADEVQEKGPLPVAEAISHALDLIEGLEQVHALGVIHRDVKPSNCFLDHEGRVKVGDFGLVRSLNPDLKLTRTGTFVGTPLYASPEQIKGLPLDARSDVYSVCATLYFLLTGHAPHEEQGRDALSLLAAVVSEDTPPVRPLRKDVPLGLDRLLSRGLSRDRERRPTDLASLRVELASFRQEMAKGWLVGLRWGAYLLDMVLLISLAHTIAFARGISLFEAMPDALGIALFALGCVVYFSAMEGLTGATVGKWLFGLRVRVRGDIVSPGWRSLVRTLLYFGLTRVFVIVATYAFSASLSNPAWAGSLNFGLTYACLAVLMVTMRKSNGYAMLHDLLSGTCVVALAGAGRGERYPGRTVEVETQGERIGPFCVLGELWRQQDECVLRAIDPSLDRSVWLWVRLSSRPELAPHRREMNHVGRPRWLSQGEHENQRWDAFLSPTGTPIVEAIAAVGKRSWEQVRSILLDLTAELMLALDERFSLAQVWLTPEGRVVLIDLPLTTAQPPTQEELLAEVAIVLLEGKPTNANLPRAVLPIHARQALLGLPRFGGTTDVVAFREQLTATSERPTRLRWPMRLLHLGLLAMSQVCFCGFIAFVIVLGTGLIVTINLKVNVLRAKLALSWHDRECAVLAVPVVAPVTTPLHRLAPALLLDKYQRPNDRARLTIAMDPVEAIATARQERLSIPSRTIVAETLRQRQLQWPNPDPQSVIGAQFAAPPWTPGPATQKFDQEYHRLEGASRSGKHILWPVGLLGMLIPVGVCVLLALLTRRGLRSMIVGIDVVRSDGTPAGPVRCAWRALLAWLPWVGVVMLASWAEESAWQAWTPQSGHTWLLGLADVAWVAFFVVPVALLALTLWTPSRSLHDRLAGTHLVPR